MLFFFNVVMILKSLLIFCFVKVVVGLFIIIILVFVMSVFVILIICCWLMEYFLVFWLREREIDSLLNCFFVSVFIFFVCKIFSLEDIFFLINRFLRMVIFG